MISELQNANPNDDFTISTITTKGDTDSRPLFEIDQKGIFEKEIDKAVLDHSVDFAIHSMKDVPSDLAEGLSLVCTPKREVVNDILVTKDGIGLDELDSDSIVGTSSLRRAVQISRKRSDLVVKPVRGNIETRIAKIDEDKYDAIVLAQAGISRLGLDAKYTTLSVSDFVPSPGQGALAIIARKEDADTANMLLKINDADTYAQITAERALSNVIESGCKFPVGAIASVNNDILCIDAVAFSVDGIQSVHAKESGKVVESANIGKMAGEKLIHDGADKLALNWREKLKEWNKNG